MRVRITHRVSFHYGDAPRNLLALLRLTPRSHEGQRVANWRIGVQPDCLLKASEDHFGNLTHMLNVTGRTVALDLTIQGEIATFDQVGVVRGSAERLPIEIFGRDTALTAPDALLRSVAAEIGTRETDRIARLHSFMGVLHDRVAVTDDAIGTKAGDVLAAREGTPAGVAHAFVAGARLLGSPARCVTGYRLDAEGGRSQRHVWAEAHVDGLGWVAFDAMHDRCPEETYIRTAVGLDADDAAALRGTRLDGLTETVSVQWLVKPASAPEAQAQG